MCTRERERERACALHYTQHHSKPPCEQNSQSTWITMSPERKSPYCSRMQTAGSKLANFGWMYSWGFHRMTIFNWRFIFNYWRFQDNPGKLAILDGREGVYESGAQRQWSKYEWRRAHVSDIWEPAVNNAPPHTQRAHGQIGKRYTKQECAAASHHDPSTQCLMHRLKWFCPPTDFTSVSNRLTRQSP